MHFFSQDGQDEFLVRLFNNKRDGFFLDIGAYDGVEFSNTFHLEKELGWMGICVEPNPAIFKKLRENRKCICLNYCISSKPGIFRFLSVTGYGVMLSGLIDFFDKKHVKRIDQAIAEYGGSKTEVNVEGIPISDILETHSVESIDYCSIDVEGGEIAVLNSIDFSKVRIKVFTIENNYGGNQVKKFLKPYGYKLIAKLGSDEVYQWKSSRYDLMLRLKVSAFMNFGSELKLSLKRKIGLFK